MNWVIIFLCCAAFIELFARLDISSRLKYQYALYKKIKRTLKSSTISDRWKEKALLHYAKQMLTSNLFLMFCFVVALLPVLIVVSFAEATGDDIAKDFVSIHGVIGALSFSALYAYIRRRLIASDTNYSEISKLFHHIALGSNAIVEASFDMEQVIFGEVFSDSLNRKHVFVAGLARAGTTFIMKTLHSTGEFCSLSYRDMPFVLAPNLWNKISRLSRKEMKAEERAHGDGIYIDFDSPEAFEEVFWRIFCGKDYIKAHCLRPMEASAEAIEHFRNYITVILKRYNANRYLSKNNNNILRMASISMAFPEAVILVPFRDPLTQANSLLEQHIRFVEKHNNSEFARKYMGWLVHHEFGSDHRPFAVSKFDSPGKDIYSIEYWLFQWTCVYGFLIREYEQKRINPIFIGYELLCGNPELVWEGLVHQLKLECKNFPDIGIKKSNTKSATINDTPLLEKAYSIYENLNRYSIQMLK